MFARIRSDLAASVVVFLVALPLCLGIALASGAPALSGMITGVIGGILVGALSRSALGVSGPAAGLVVIVIKAAETLGSYELFLGALVLAGLMQVALGFFKAGVLAYYFPSSVIHGMLAGIGLIIIVKQIPQAIGFESDVDITLRLFNLGSLITSVVALSLLIAWELPLIKRSALRFVPGPLIAVASGIICGVLLEQHALFRFGSGAFVDLPVVSLTSLASVLPSPDFSRISSLLTWKIAVTIAVVASVETLLSVEATDKLDPRKRVTPTNRELIAQGVGNAVAGLVGGLPVTQVVVRSSANIQAGGTTKLSALLHGALLLLSLFLFPGLLRLIPLASLAAVLLVVGYKLANPAMFVEMWRKGRSQFIPFVATVLGVVFTDLLVGVAIGLVCGTMWILHTNYKVPFHFNPQNHVPGSPVRIQLSEDVSFLNKASIQRTLKELPPGTRVEIDASHAIRIDPDVEEVIRDAVVREAARDVRIQLLGFEPESRGTRPNDVTAFRGHVETLSSSSQARQKDSKGRPS